MRKNGKGRTPDLEVQNNNNNARTGAPHAPFPSLPFALHPPDVTEARGSLCHLSKPTSAPPPSCPLSPRVLKAY